MFQWAVVLVNLFYCFVYWPDAVLMLARVKCLCIEQHVILIFVNAIFASHCDLSFSCGQNWVLIVRRYRRSKLH